VPLRGGSKSIPKKNIKLLNGKPLCSYVLDAAVKSTVLDQIYVSTDCSEIAEIVYSLGIDVHVIRRPSEISQDSSSTEEAMIHLATQVDFDHLITLQATSPLLTELDIDNAYLHFTSGIYDSLLSATRVKRFFWSDDSKPLNYKPSSRPRRQDFAGTLMENGAIYITSRNVLASIKCRLGGRIGIYEMPEHTAIEIDEPSDWNLVESLLLSRQGKL